MKRVVQISLVAYLAVNVYAADEISKENREKSHSVKQIIQKVGAPKTKEVTLVKSVKDMFEQGTVKGRLIGMYSGHEVDNDADPYTTAVGGQLKYKLGVLNGFNAGVEFTTAHNVNFATGSGDTAIAGGEHNYYLSSEDGSYTEVSQAYINYTYEDLNLRLGRQQIDTPFADSDDIRIISNTFEAAMVTYEVSDFSLTAGYLSRWQGTDTGLSVDDAWQDTGDDGTYFGGVAYGVDAVDASFWYYDISEADNGNTATGNVANKTAYADVSVHLNLSEDYFLHLSAQYSKQSESDNSAIESEIYGAMGDLVIMEDFTLGFAYNKSEKKSGKGSFPGFGGGALYTNMDNMIIDAITLDRKSEAFVIGGAYSYNDFGFLYAYGDFDGDADSNGDKEHIVEQNIGVDYKVNDDLTIAGICVINDNKENTGSNAYFTEGDFINYRLWVTYNF